MNAPKLNQIHLVRGVAAPNARLGFDPSQPPFGDCAADLRAALARASDPAM